MCVKASIETLIGASQRYSLQQLSFAVGLLEIAAITRFRIVIVIGNWFVLRGREELEALGHERCQVVIIGSDIIQYLLDSSAKLCKGCVVTVACNLPLQELPETLDQVQVG